MQGRVTPGRRTVPRPTCGGRPAAEPAASGLRSEGAGRSRGSLLELLAPLKKPRSFHAGSLGMTRQRISARARLCKRFRARCRSYDAKGIHRRWAQPLGLSRRCHCAGDAVLPESPRPPGLPLSRPRRCCPEPELHLWFCSAGTNTPQRNRMSCWRPARRVPQLSARTLGAK